MSVVPIPPDEASAGRDPARREARGSGIIVGGLIDNGMTAIEIPLNSPDPFRSIEIAVRKAPAGILVGAGGV